MRTLYVISLVSVLVFLFASPLCAQWIQTQGPYGGSIHCFAAGGRNLFAGTNERGVYRSTDSGTTWTPANAGLNMWINCLVVKDSILLAGIYAYGFFRSTDYGQTWAELNPYFYGDYCPSCWEITTLAYDGPTLYAGTNGGLFRSMDNGDTWSPTGFGGYAWTLAVKGDTLFVGTWGEGILRSYDSGVNWQNISSGIPDNYIQCSLMVDTNLFAGTLSHGLYRSTDNGNSWTQSGFTGTGVISLVNSGKKLIAAAAGSIFLSTNNGESWTTITSGLNAVLVEPVAVFDSMFFAGSWDGGVYRSTNNGASWSEANNGMNGTRVSCLAASDTTVVAGTGNGDMYRLTDNGTSWARTSLVRMWQEQVLATISEGNNFLAGTGGTMGGYGVFRSTDDGQTWAWPGPVSCSDPAVSSLLAAGTILFAGTEDEGLYRSSDGGTSWTKCDSLFFYYNPIQAMAIRSNKLFAGTRRGIYCSADSGVTWTEKDVGLVNRNVQALVLIDSILLASTADEGMYQSTDGGENWIAVNVGLTDTYVSNLILVAHDVFAGTSKGIFRSSDRGSSWSDVSLGMTDLAINALAASKTYLYGSGWSGVWKRPLAEIVTSTQAKGREIPNEFKLFQNYPNPFNPTSTISYSLPQKSFVTLKLYDLLGRAVRTLVNSEQEPGNYSRIVEANDLPSGVYFYRLQAGNPSASSGHGFTDIKKMLLVK